MNKYLTLALISLCACTTQFTYEDDTHEEGDTAVESDTASDSIGDTATENDTVGDTDLEGDTAEESDGTDAPDEAEVGPCAGLTQWFLDQDDDGYGQDTSWVCAATQPSGYVVVDGDCCDENMDVHPDQEEWFTATYTCPHVSWDYNCTGALERVVPDNENIAEYGECLTRTTQGDCEQPSGWIETIPACGETGQYWICTWNISEATCQGASAFEGSLSCH